MKKKIKIICLVMLWIISLIILMLNLYLFFYPAVASLTCKAENGCMNESGMFIIFGLFLSQLTSLLIFLSIYGGIRTLRKSEDI